MFNNIYENINYINSCVLCKKKLDYYLCGFNKAPFLSNYFLYSKTKLENNILFCTNKKLPVAINIVSNEVLEGADLLQEMLHAHLDFYKKCTTCNFQINFLFYNKNLIDGKYLSSSSPLKEELVYTSAGKKVYINSNYKKNYDYVFDRHIVSLRTPAHLLDNKNECNTFIYYNKKNYTITKPILHKYKSYKEINNFIKTLMLF